MKKGFMLAMLVLLSTAMPAQAQVAATSGGGGDDGSLLEAPLTTQQRQAIEAAIDRNRQTLEAAGKRTINPAADVVLTWPLQAADSLVDFGYHGTSNFVDQDATFPQSIQDYHCGTRTYDRTNGYNHQGIDYVLWPFPWYKMDHDLVEIVAAAPGMIIFKQEGNFDRSCSFGGSWNVVHIEHADGSIALYGHMKNGSVTAKDIGETVERGEYLGIVGSSGSSTRPHLHLEIHDANNNLIEPHAGACNRFNTASWWQEQPDYYDPAVNALTTGDAAPEFPSCPNQEQPHIRDTFDLGERIYFTTYYRDQQATQQSRYTIVRPDGSTFSTWIHSISESHFPVSWWWWSFDIPTDVPVGQWTFQVDFAGQSYTHYFTLKGLATATETALEWPEGYRLSAAYPNPFNPTTQVTLELQTDQHVRLVIYDLLGRSVALLHDGLLAARERHSFMFEAGSLPSGIYLLEATGDAFSATRRVVLLK